MAMNVAQAAMDVFPKIKARFEREQERGDGLICKEGFYDGCSVLKLQKPCWTNDRMDQVRNESGIFFSVWTDQKNANRVNYNIHALKLRLLKGYSITSRNFAEDFRNAFAPVRGPWPNVSVDYGPLTLMQGWIETDTARLDEDVAVLMTRFFDVARIIDRLLASRRRDSD